MMTNDSMREKLEKARLAGGFDAERTVRGRFAQMRRLEAEGIRLEFPQGTEAGAAVASAGLKSGASAGPHDREMPGAFRLGTNAARRGRWFGEDPGGHRTAVPDGCHGQEAVQEQPDGKQSGRNDARLPHAPNDLSAVHGLCLSVVQNG